MVKFGLNLYFILYSFYCYTLKSANPFSGNV